MTTTTKSPEETRAISRLRALGQGIRVFCLDQDKLYCFPSASGDGSAYQVQVSGETMTCSCAAGRNDKWCKHLAAVTMYQEAQAQLQQATSQAVTVGLHDQLEASIRACAVSKEIAEERSLEDKLADIY